MNKALVPYCPWSVPGSPRRCHFGSGSNPVQTRVGYKEIRKRALQDHNPDALIGLEFPAEFVEFLRSEADDFAGPGHGQRFSEPAAPHAHL
jgi:hypothetical protein